MAMPEPRKPHQSEFIKDQQDRVAADPEMVGHILNPNRSPETVRFRDPSETGTAYAPDRGTPQSMAEMEMSRRTDAGRHEANAGFRAGSNMWLVGAALLVVLILALAWMWGMSSQ